MADVESRAAYFTELFSKEIHFVLQAGGTPTAGRVALLEVYLTKNRTATAQIVTAGGGERTIVDKTRGLYTLELVAADLDTDGALTIEIVDTGAVTENKFIHLKLDPVGRTGGSG